MIAWNVSAIVGSAASVAIDSASTLPSCCGPVGMRLEKCSVSCSTVHTSS